MSSSHAVKRPLHGASLLLFRVLQTKPRSIHLATQPPKTVSFDGRNRLSRLWSPTQRKANGEDEHDSHQLLVRAGFLRQAHSGIFHLLPLGLRVQNKIESLIDEQMARLGASKVSLSSISSETLWQRSGRLEGRDSEFFKLEDRKGAKYLLSPTHEEEITSVVANAVHSYRDLPLRLYQVSRKYRDEARPRQGLLRGREFVMKDLYTFDTTESEARNTYEQVRRSYCAFLDQLRIPYTVAQADSGNMGGRLSHEYHFVSANGEDTIISCDSCDTVLNEELYTGTFDPQRAVQPTDSSFKTWYGISKDRKTAIVIHLPDGNAEVNVYAVKELVPSLDTSKQVYDRAEFSHCKHAVAFADPRLSLETISLIRNTPCAALTVQPDTVQQAPTLLTRLRDGDACPSCNNGIVRLSPAVEIGHTFHLGKRYSIPLEANVLDADNRQVAVEMGCHGIGVSRLIAAVAGILADSEGLNWPLRIAPFGAVLVASNGTAPEDLNALYDDLASACALDVAIDDRDRAMGWKLNDADLIGYPFIVVLGKAWARNGAVELQCRRLGIREVMPASELTRRLGQYSERL